MSGNSETPQMNSRNRSKRIPPSTRLKMTWPPSAGFAFLSSVAASRGRYLYMKIKKASEIITLPAASQPLMLPAFSRFCDLEDCNDEDFAEPCSGGTFRLGS